VTAISTPGAVMGTTSTREPEGWWERGTCRRLNADPELFFGADNERGNRRRDRETAAKEYCEACPVTTLCLEDALEKGSEGVWGGTNDSQRRKILKARKEARKKAEAPAKPRKLQSTKVRREPTVRPGCGTPSGGRNHSARGEEACEPCKTARRESDRQKREAQRRAGELTARAKADAARSARAQAVRAQIAAKVEDLIDTGADFHRAATELGRRPDTLERLLYRAQRPDLIAKLKRAA
jgi:WhiB family redox-sensing transcriptional regulator